MICMDEELKRLFLTVLPVCSVWIAKGAKIPVRQRIDNAEALTTRAVVQAARREHTTQRGRAGPGQGQGLS